MVNGHRVAAMGPRRMIRRRRAVAPGSTWLHDKSELSKMIDKTHFFELSQRDPQDVCGQALCEYDTNGEQYILRVWDDEYRISPDRMAVDSAVVHGNSSFDYFGLFAVHYLLGAKPADLSNEWISEKDIPGGATFFRGPHAIPTALISDRFGNDIDRFTKRCKKLLGTPLDMADVAYRFEITSRIPVAVLYWQGDDDFPAESSILYDKTIIDHLASDVVYALAVGICRRLGQPIGAST